MIRHIVFFSATHPENVPRMEAALQQLAAIPEALHLEVGRNTRHDALSQEIDLVVYGEFADAAALERYKQHALYHECIKVVRPLRELRLAADIEGKP